MKRSFSKVQSIMDNNNNDFIIDGVVVYVLTNEEEPYKLYRLNLENSDDMKEIIRNNVKLVDDETIYFTYTQCSEPNGRETLSYIPDNQIPNYDILKQKILNDEATALNKSNFLEKINEIKGYVIKILYTNNTDEVDELEDNNQGHIICYSNLNKNYMFKTKRFYFKFCNENGDLLQKVDDTYIKFNDSIFALNFHNTVFVFHGWYFEQLLKYDSHINTAATTVLVQIQNQNLINNIELLEEKAINSKNVRKKLFKISKEGNIDNTTFDKFKELKDRYGDGLIFNINENNNNISIKEDNKNKSIDHILRIYNDEGAETFLSQQFIFANQKIPIEQ